MNFAQTLMNNFDPEIAGRLLSRREAAQKLGEAAQKLGKLGAGLALASVAVQLGLLSTATFGKGKMPQAVNDVLNFALTLEHLEAEFYTKGLLATNLIPASDKPIFNQISKHENAHVILLQSILGSAATTKPQFDFTANGTFADVFTNYQTFLALSQGFEDTGVRAYKGQAGNLMTDNAALTTALQIHSVEARHASEVRRLRNQKGWITNASTDVSALQPIYAGENNTTQGSVEVAALSIDVPASSVTEAFDEPLTSEQVLAIASMFMVS